MASDTRGWGFRSLWSEAAKRQYDLAQENESSGVQDEVPAPLNDKQAEQVPEFGLCLLIVALLVFAGICFTGEFEWLLRLTK